MKKFACVFALLVLVGPAMWAGVVIELEEKDAGSTGDAPTHKIYAQGQMLRMDPHVKGSTDDLSVIFRDDKLWIVNHTERTCQTIDKEGMQQLSSQLGAAMSQMEASLSQLPPEQRAMLEKMMKSKMPAGMPGMGEAPPRRMETGGTEQVGEYSCVVHTLYAGDERAWEVCAASKSQLSGASEAMEAFQAISGFMSTLREAVQQGPFSSMANTPFYDMDQIDGFPVRVRKFDNGRMTSESTLKSVTRKQLDDAIFSVPEGYAVQDLADQINRGR